MAKYQTEDIRNLAIVGTAGAGKTTLVEQMLHDAGVIGRVGRVEDGNTVCDHTDLEKEVKHSLEAAVVHFDHAGAHVNLIDTPGSSDLVGTAMSAFPGVDVVTLVVDATAALGSTERRLMKMAAARNLPRMIVINKIDQATDLGETLEAVQEIFGSECKAINLPAAGGTAVIDCFQNATGESDLGDVSGFHTAIIDQVVEV
ncbi:MAG: GTP-binding protein, partial [Phycisphaerales bacterium]|nr:GTP-binding protein [Phycisphaerales bacterium]